MLKKLFLVILALILLALPIAARWFYLYEGRYEPGEVSRPDLTTIQLPTPEGETFEDDARVFGPGAILVDLAHDNRVDIAELGVLQTRLSARGQHLESVVAVEDLAQQLRYAKALMVISPGMDWLPHEIEEVQTFVDKGGLLVLVADPTRYGIVFDEWDLPVYDDDVSHINDLAARFGVLFVSDYLYNTADNVGNFRNIKLTDFAEDTLTQGLDHIVFSAARSILSEHPALIWTGGETRSSNNEQVEDLAVATLAGDGKVLALGDLTFMTEPNNSTMDNDQLVANIADFLSTTERRYELADFPYYFDDLAYLVYMGAPLLDSDLLGVGSTLQTRFAAEGRELTVREVEDGETDTLFLGLYEDSEDVESYLSAAQVTLWITPTEDTDDESPSEEPDDSVSKPTPTVPASASVAITPGITVTEPLTPSAKARIEVGAMGEMVVTGTALLLLQDDGRRQVLVGMADTEAGLESAIERLMLGILEGCLLHDTDSPSSMLALCPTGEILPRDGESDWTEPELPVEPDLPEPESPITDTVEPSEPNGDAAANVIVVAVDTGEARYDGMTSTADYELLLSDAYNVEVMSVAQDGLPDWEYFIGYDLVIWSWGDYEDALSDDESDTLFEIMLEGIPIVLSGASVGDSDTRAAHRDIQVGNADHPMAAGFEQGEVITFVIPPSGDAYETNLLEVGVEENGTYVPFVRGPESEEAGAPAVFIMEDEFSGVRVAFVGFPIYLLPEETKERFVLDMVDWMISP